MPIPCELTKQNLVMLKVSKAFKRSGWLFWGKKGATRASAFSGTYTHTSGRRNPCGFTMLACSSAFISHNEKKHYRMLMSSRASLSAIPILSLLLQTPKPFALSQNARAKFQKLLPVIQQRKILLGTAQAKTP